MATGNIDLWVSGGSFDAPYYQFYTNAAGTEELTELSLDTDYTYTFRRLGGATSHPFYLSDTGFKEASTDAITISGYGSPSAGITGNQAFTVSFNNDAGDIDDLLYYCSSHSSMQGNIQLLEASPATPIIRGNSLYTIVDGPSWTEAEANSVKIGGDLITINNVQEEDFVFSKFDEHTYNGHRAGFWIGLNADNEEREWEWISGEKASYRNWAHNAPHSEIHPDNYWIMEKYGHAIGSRASETVFGNEVPGKWNDLPNLWETWDGKSTEMNIGVAEIPFVRRGDSAYVIVEGPTWEEAETNAVALGGHLVTINDAQENQWLVQNYYGKDLLSETLENKSVWIGYNDIKNEGNWEWSSGETSNYKNWGSGEPDGRETYKAGEEYAEFLLFDSYNRDPGQWGDNANNANSLGIAEIPLAPNNAPTGTPNLSGDFKVGQTISINPSAIEDEDNFEGWTPTYEYSWEVSGDNGTTWTALTSTDATDDDDSYTLTSEDAGKQLRGVVSYLDGYGTNEVVVSDAASPIASLPLAIKGLPHVGHAIEIDSDSIPEGYEVIAAGLEKKDPTGTVRLYWEDFKWSVDTDSIYRLYHKDTVFIETLFDQSKRFDEYGENTVDFLIGDKLIEFAPGILDAWGVSLPTTQDVTGELQLIYKDFDETTDNLRLLGYEAHWDYDSLLLRPRDLMPSLDISFAVNPDIKLEESTKYRLLHGHSDPHDLRAVDKGAEIRGYAELISPTGEYAYAQSPSITIQGVTPAGSVATQGNAFSPNNAPQGDLLITGKSESGQTLSLNTSSITDEDGIDTAFTHSWQVYDIDSSSWLNLDTADATDGNESLTLTSALIGNELRGRAAYTDGNGLTEVVASDSFTVTAAPPTGPYQEISTPSDTIYFALGGTLSVPLIYSHTPDQPNGGITIDVHYDSSRFSPVGENNGVSNMLGYTPTNLLVNSTIVSDNDNRDNDPDTDQAIRLSWINTSQDFPGTELPAELGTLNFQNLDSSESVDPITGSRLNITAWDQPDNYGFVSSSLELLPQEFNLDVNGDGKVSLYTDGIMVIRRLIGLETCTDGFSFDQPGMRTAEETDQLLDYAYDQGFFNFDQVGDRPSLYTDGILMIRYLISPGLVSQSNDLIGAGSPYKDNAEGLISMFDSLRP